MSLSHNGSWIGGSSSDKADKQAALSDEVHCCNDETCNLMEEEKENVPFEPKSRGRLEALTLNDHMRYTIPKYTRPNFVIAQGGTIFFVWKGVEKVLTFSWY